MSSCRGHAGPATASTCRLQALICSVGSGRSTDVTGVAVPAHWRQSDVDVLRTRLPRMPVVSGAVAALTALQAHPGLPAQGIIALGDFGATGISITLADADTDLSGTLAVAFLARLRERCRTA